MAKLLAPILLLTLSACSGESFDAGEHLPQAGAAPTAGSEVGGSEGLAGAPSAPVAGAGGQGGAEDPAPSAGRAGEAPGGAAGQGGQAGAGGQPQAGSAGQAGAAPTAGSPAVPDACSPPSPEGPTSGSRDCSAECADGSYPCQGTCDGMAHGGCSPTFTATEPGSDFSFVLEPGYTLTFQLQGKARLTGMPGTFATFTGKTQAQDCLAIDAEQLESVAAKVTSRGWVRVQVGSFSCAP